MSIVHVFPDAESMELHLQGVDELAKKAFEFMEIVSFLYRTLFIAGIRNQDSVR